MADDEQAKPARKSESKQQARTQTQTQSEESENYTREGWKERARQRFKVSPHAVAGALHDVGPEDKLSEADVQTRVDEFMGREHPPPAEPPAEDES